VLSFILISIGTNIPELSIAIRSLFEKKTTIAFGNYVGSASFNTLELGLLSMIHGQKIPAFGSNYAVILFAVGMFLFLIFSRSKKSISRKESLVLLLVYVGIILMELFLKGGWNLW
jgi:Ca2+/Na+ antiporter